MAKRARHLGWALCGAAPLVSSAPLFEKPPPLPAPAGALASVSGDFDGDGRLDVATTLASGVAVALNAGAGRFTPPVLYPLAPAPFLVSADFDADGALDLAQGVSGGAELLWGNGDGSFRTGARIDFIRRPEQDFIDSLTDIVVGDFDADGLPDLVLAYEGHDGDWRSSFDVFFARPGATFAAPLRTDLPGRGTLIAADLDEDGLTDLASATNVCWHGDCGGISLHTFLGDGAGGFLSALVDAPPVGYAANATGLRAGDYDGDGHLDLVLFASGGTIDPLAARRWLYRGNGDGTFASGEPAPVPVNVDVWPPFNRVISADADGDGRLDLIGDGAGHLHFMRGDGRGAFEPPLALALAPAYAPVLLGADFDGDGEPDALLSDPLTGAPATRPLRELRRSSIPVTTFERDVAPESAQLADVNGDGKLDLILPSLTGFAVAFGDGFGRFAPPVYHDLGAGGGDYAWSAGSQLVVSDLDGDGALDVAMPRRPPAPSAGPVLAGVLIAFGDGRGGVSALLELTEPSTGGWYSASLAGADIDADGDQDLWLAAFTCCGEPGRLVPLLNDGAGTFTAAAPAPLPSEPYDLQTADLDADGRVDLLINGTDYLLNLGAGQLAPARHIDLAGSPSRFADLDADGLLDAVSHREWRRNQGDGTFAPPAPFDPTEPEVWYERALAIADLDADGRPDLLRTRPEGIVLHRAAATGAAPSELLLPGARAAALFVADVAGDGRGDIASVSGGNVFVYEQKGAQDLRGTRGNYRQGPRSAGPPGR